MSRDDEKRGAEGAPPDDPLKAALEAAAAALDENGRVRAAEEAAAAEEARAEEAAGAEQQAAPASDALARELEDWKSRAYRVAADLENARKRFAREREEQKKFAIEGILKDLLPVADNLQRAVSHAADPESPLAQGVQMVLKQLLGTLERHGAKSFDPKGQPFDPQFHEAMTQLPRGDVEPGTVVETFQQGWMLHERLVRPAMVIVSRSPDGEGAQA
jgi:molecular chaperone GrpE